MRWTTRIAVMALAIASLLGIASSTVGATTWHNSGDTAFTATGGSGTLSSTGFSLTFSSSTTTGTTGPSPYVGGTWRALIGRFTATGARITGAPVGFSCDLLLTATTWVAGPPSVALATNDVTCSATIGPGATVFCHIEGTTSGVYWNPSGTTNGRWHVNTTSVGLTATDPAARDATCPFGNGDRVTFTRQTLNVTAGNVTGLGPVVTRTP